MAWPLQPEAFNLNFDHCRDLFWVKTTETGQIPSCYAKFTVTFMWSLSFHNTFPFLSINILNHFIFTVLPLPLQYYKALICYLTFLDMDMLGRNEVALCLLKCIISSPFYAVIVLLDEQNVNSLVLLFSYAMHSYSSCLNFQVYHHYV